MSSKWLDEALIREWPALQTWLQEDREGLRTRRRLTDAAQRWAAGERDAGDLFRGARLTQAEVWVQETDRALTPLERDFLGASLAERRRLEEVREAQRQRELEAAQHLADAQERRAEERGRFLGWLALVAALLLVAAVTAALLGRSYRTASLESVALADANATAAAENAVVAATAQAAESQAIAAQKQEAEQRIAAETAEREAAAQRDIAQQQARINLAMGLAGQAAVHQEKASELALLLALEADAMLDAPQSRGALMSALEHSPGRVRYLTGSTGLVQSLTLSPDATILASASSNEIRFWDTVTGEPVGEPIAVPGDEARDVVFLGDGGILAVLARTFDAEAAPYVLFWEWAPGTGIGQPLGILTSTHFSAGIESYIAAGPDGQSLVLVGCRDLTTVPSGSVFCAGGGGATLWDISGILDGSGDGIEVDHLEITGEVWAVAISPDGASVALGGCAIYGDTALRAGIHDALAARDRHRLAPRHRPRPGGIHLYADVTCRCGGFHTGWQGVGHGRLRSGR